MVGLEAESLAPEVERADKQPWGKEKWGVTVTRDFP